MGVFFGEVTLETVKGRASYHDISDEIRENIKKSELKNGCCHIMRRAITFFSILTNCMYDTMPTFEDENIRKEDDNDELEKSRHPCKNKNQYHSPGPKHIEFGLSWI